MATLARRLLFSRSSARPWLFDLPPTLRMGCARESTTLGLFRDQSCQHPSISRHAAQQLKRYIECGGGAYDDLGVTPGGVISTDPGAAGYRASVAIPNTAMVGTVHFRHSKRDRKERQQYSQKIHKI